MPIVTTTSRATGNLPAFLSLTLLFSLPFYILATLVPPEAAMLSGLSLTVAPISAALVLTFRQDRADGVKQLLRRALDTHKIARRKWYIAILFLWPFIFTLALGLLNLMGVPLAKPALPLLVVPAALLVFFLFALLEEVGWMGYAYLPLEQRWRAARGGLILGLIWAIWHLPIFLATSFGLQWIIGQLIVLAVSRILYVWLFNNNAQSVFAAILFHTVYNVCTMMFPVYGAVSGPATTAVIVLMVVVMVVLLWGADTLARFRLGKVELISALFLLLRAGPEPGSGRRP